MTGRDGSSDASAHRVVSDLSALVGRESGHRILAAGALNILHGHGERGSSDWASRYGTVFDRIEALGLPFVGPQAPHGRQAVPWLRELPRESKNVPTYHSNRQAPDTARRQLDFVFASSELEGSVRVRALNEPDQEASVSPYCMATSTTPWVPSLTGATHGLCARHGTKAGETSRTSSSTCPSPALGCTARKQRRCRTARNCRRASDPEHRGGKHASDTL